MTDDERKSLLARLATATKKAKKMPRDAARQKLIDEGFYTQDGHLSADYGGKAVVRG